jgi:hypothetical protein
MRKLNRKLKLNRETLCYLEEKDLQTSPVGQAGGDITPLCTILTCARTCGAITCKCG